MRDDRARLVDVLAAADAISAFTSAKTRQSLETDDLLLSGISHKLMLISEAVSRISRDLKARHPEVPWREIQGFRNRVIHEYFSLDRDILWETASRDVPELRVQFEAILAAEFPRG